MAKGHSPATIHSRQSAMALTMPMRHSPRQAKIPAMHETMHPISRRGDSLKKNRCVLGGHGDMTSFYISTPLERPSCGSHMLVSLLS